jgi:hypothetical protein
VTRYPRADLELITSADGGNAYQSAEEWVTDEEASKPSQQNPDGKKVRKLTCVDKWWRGDNVSIKLAD